MAKKKKKKKNPIVRFLRSVLAFFKDERFRYAMGIVFLLLALFLILSLISYLINWKTDQDFELIDAQGTAEKILNSQVTHREMGSVSLMPPGLERTLTDVELADLIAYLKTLQ